MATIPEIQVEDITKIYQGNRSENPCLKQINLKFFRGVCTGIMGHNGAGKTTTVRIILGLLKPNKGNVLFRGKPMCSGYRKHIGYMPEADRIAKNLSPSEILRYQLRLFTRNLSHKKSNQKILKALEDVGLKGSEDKLVRTLSKGMRRRLSWAQATIHDPDIIILDEPFSGMDPLGRIQIQEWIRQQSEIGKTLILCTHQLDAMFDYCNDFYILRRGEVVYSSNLKEDSLNIEYQPHSLETSLSFSEIESLKKTQCLCEWQSQQLSKQGSKLIFKNLSEIQEWSKAIINSSGKIYCLKPAFGEFSTDFNNLFDGDAVHDNDTRNSL